MQCGHGKSGANWVLPPRWDLKHERRYPFARELSWGATLHVWTELPNVDLALPSIDRRLCYDLTLEEGNIQLY